MKKKYRAPPPKCFQTNCCCRVLYAIKLKVSCQSYRKLSSALRQQKITQKYEQRISGISVPDARYLKRTSADHVNNSSWPPAVIGQRVNGNLMATLPKDAIEYDMLWVGRLDIYLYSLSDYVTDTWVFSPNKRPGCKSYLIFLITSKPITVLPAIA